MNKNLRIDNNGSADYGDEWRFTVELKEIRKAEEKESEPVILESTGKAPVQYPPCEEDKSADE